MRRQAVSLLAQAFESSQLLVAGQSNATGLLLKRAFADAANLKKTALHDFHVANGGEPPQAVSYALCRIKAT
jgi:hypothetical protein